MKKPQNTDELLNTMQRIKSQINADEMTTLDVLRECGRLALPPEHALTLLLGKLTSDEYVRLKQALKNPDSPEMQHYMGGVAAGETEIAQALHTGVTDLEKDGYKNMDAERRHKAVSKSIRKNFGIGADDEE